MLDIWSNITSSEVYASSDLHAGILSVGIVWMKYFLVNTNAAHGCHEQMLETRRVTAYCDPWKFQINRISEGDHVFLYYSGHGICAYGIASGGLIVEDHDCDGTAGEKYSMNLDAFELFDPVIDAKTCKKIAKFNGLQLRLTCAELNPEHGERLVQGVLI